MKHDRVIGRDGFDILAAAAIWPRADALIQAPMGEVQAALDTRTAPGNPDVPEALGPWRLP